MLLPDTSVPNNITDIKRKFATATSKLPTTLYYSLHGKIGNWSNLFRSGVADLELSVASLNFKDKKKDTSL